MIELKFYTDTHVASAIVEQLRIREIDIVRCEEVGLAEASDREHFEYAIAEQRTIITGDLGAGFEEPLFEAIEAGVLSYGILRIASHLRLRPGYSIGPLVTFVTRLHRAVQDGTIDPEQQVYNQIRWITGR